MGSSMGGSVPSSMEGDENFIPRARENQKKAKLIEPLRKYDGQKFDNGGICDGDIV